MPYKDRDRRNKYSRNYMKNQRKAQAQIKRMMQEDKKAMASLQRSFPDAYKLLFGKGKRRRK